MRKIKWMLALAAVALLAIAAGCSWSTVATVDGAKVTEKEFYAELEKQHGREVLERLITEKIILQEASKKNITVTDKEIEEEMARIKGMFPTEQEFINAVKQYYGMSVDMLRQRIKLDKLANKVRTADIKVSDAEMSKFLGERRYLRHILVREESEAKAIQALLKDNGDFAQLAKQRSTDPGSKSRGGLLGFVKKGDMVPDFEKVAFALKEGETSSIVKTPYGYHLIRSEKPDRKEAEDAIKKEKAEPVDAWIARLRQNSKIDIKRDQYKDLADSIKSGGKQQQGQGQPAPAAPSR